MDVHVVDLFGLTDPIASRMMLGERGRPGHEKLLPDVWVIGRFGSSDRTSDLPGVADAARAVECGEVGRLIHAVSDPLTPARFFANMRAAWTFHRLRIPVDPATALTWCGAAVPGRHAAAYHPLAS
jgi:arabinofuranosyltransferase